jgi:hypothetical protein
MSPTSKTGTVTDRLTVARQDEQAANERVNFAEADLKAALDGQDYAKAEKAKTELEAAREAAVIASAHAQALQAGVNALEQQRAAERQALAEHEAKQHANVLFEQAREREAEAQDEVQRHLADIEPAYEALRRVMQAALDAEHRQGNFRQEADGYAKAAGQTDPGLPAPMRPNLARTRIDMSPVLTQVFRTRVTH